MMLEGGVLECVWLLEGKARARLGHIFIINIHEFIKKREQMF